MITESATNGILFSVIFLLIIIIINFSSKLITLYFTNKNQLLFTQGFTTYIKNTNTLQTVKSNKAYQIVMSGYILITTIIIIILLSNITFNEPIEFILGSISILIIPYGITLNKYFKNN